MRLFTGGNHRFVFRRVFIGLEQYFVELRLDWLWTLLGTQRLCPRVDLGLDGLTFGNARQRLLEHLLAGFFEPTLTSSTEIVWCFEQAKQGRSQLHGGWLGAKVIGCQVGKTKLLLTGTFPRQVQVNFFGGGCRLAQQLRGLGLFKPQEGMGRFDFVSFA